MIEYGLYFVTLTMIFFAAAIIAWLLIQSFGRYWQEYKDTFTESTSTDMADMFMFIDPQRLFLLNIGGILLIPLLTWLISQDIIMTVSAAIGMALLPSMIYKSLRKRRLKKFETQLPDAFMMISASLQAGASLNMALEGLIKEQPAPLSQEFELLIRQQRIGVDMETALSNMEKRMPSSDFIVATSAIKIAREVGGNLIEVMETLADTLRRKAAMEGKIESLTAQGKLQGKVMTGLPILLGVILFQMEPEAMGKMFTTPMGWATLAVIVVMEFLGYMVIRKITSIDV
ncbi:Flp pilus assembly protein TadB [hydrothermal vent metagenome]|uniref:Flp pilus assembly protein TadB n=1 Tax=hydrothermal vent metagenome TaxID=652676 RepID=A0A3B1AAU0_9ZZZZ